MTTPEVPGQQGEQQVASPEQVARKEFNAALFGEYNGSSLVSRTIQLQNTLLRSLRSDLTPEKIYHELSIVSGQGAERAELFVDQETATTLRELQRGFELTYETFKPKSQTAVSTPAQPTRTADLPPMTSPKGGETSRVTQGRRTPVQPPTAVTAGTLEQPEAPKEETFSSFLRQKRTEAKKSQRVLGQTLGPEKTNNLKISGLENGKPTVDLDGINKIILDLGLSEEDKQKALALYEKQFPPKPQE